MKPQREDIVKSIIAIFIECGNLNQQEIDTEISRLDIFENQIVDSFSFSVVLALIEEKFEIDFEADEMSG